MTPSLSFPAMSFFAVLFALLIEQLKPLPRDNWAHEALAGWGQWTSRNLDAGRAHHAWVVWGVTVLLLAALAALIHIGIARYSDLLAVAFDVAVLYLTLGFRQFSHYFTDIRAALERGDEFEARRLLAQWQHVDASELPRTEIVRHVIEHSLLAAHRHVFGVFFCFVVFSALGLGPAGALFYRMAEYASRYWAATTDPLGSPPNPRLAELSRRLFAIIDHLPARLTAFGFAVVGNFEEAINGWRRHAELWPRENEGIILASAAGAVGVRMGGEAPPAATMAEATVAAGAFSGGDPQVEAAEGSTPGSPAQVGHLHSVVGLVWRSVVLWMLMLALLTLANVIG
jgi:adenosylcobinamide-phosphate synthase